MNQSATNPNGQLFRSLAIENSPQVTPLVMTAKRITLEWRQDGKTGHLDATSHDGIHFHAQYGFASNACDFKCELTLYQAQGEQLLFGTWWDNAAATQGILAFRLPTKSAEPNASRSATTIVERQTPAVRSAATKPRNSGDRQSTEKPAPAAGPSPAGTSLTARPPEAAEDAGRPTPRQPLARPVQPAAVPPSAQVDHLLAMTPEQFELRDRGTLEQQLTQVPLSAVFKVAHNALSAEMKALAGAVFANRYGGLAAASPAAPVQRPPEPPEFKAIKRRSSRHSKNR